MNEEEKDILKFFVVMTILIILIISVLMFVNTQIDIYKETKIFELEQKKYEWYNKR